MGTQDTRFCPISLVDSIESKEIREGRTGKGLESLRRWSSNSQRDTGYQDRGLFAGQSMDRLDLMTQETWIRAGLLVRGEH